MTIDWTHALAIGASAIGVIQWAKGLAKGAPTWVWAAALPPLCAGLALAPSPLVLAALGLAVAQLGYENILKAIAGKVGLPK